MSRIVRFARVSAVAALVAVVLAAASSASAAPSAKVVNGTVGPSFTIGMTLGGKKVARLKAGVAYRFVISDRSAAHDFHLSGPGVSRVLTDIGYTGTKSYVMKLKKGKYSYVCDPHAGEMHGGFVVS